MDHFHPRQFLFPLLVCFSFALISLSFTTSHAFQFFNAPPAIVLQSPRDFNDANQITYPIEINQWGELITRFAMQYSLDPNLVAAIMLIESNGDPNAYSTSGAVGLMQIMPSDGIAASFSCNGKPCFQDRPLTKDLWDPASNIRFGCRLLQEYQRQYGSLREALKHYGPYDVGYWYADQVISLVHKLEN